MYENIVSIVCAVYNREQYIDALLNSLLAQVYTHYELIFIDDASTDSSFKILQEFKQNHPDKAITLLRNPDHRGVQNSLSMAFEFAKGEYGCWVDSDDILLPYALFNCVLRFQSLPDNYGLIYTNYGVIDKDGNYLRPGARCQRPYNPTRLLVDFMVFHFRMFRMSAYHQIDGIDPRSSLPEDYDFVLRMAEQFTIDKIASEEYLYRVHPDSYSQQNARQQVEQTRNAIEAALKRRKLDVSYYPKVTWIPTVQLMKRQSNDKNIRSIEETIPILGEPLS